MNFDKAYKELLAGKKIRRKEWDYLMHLRMINGKPKAFEGEINSYYTNVAIIASNKWKVIDGDGKELTFIEAIEELKNKKCIRQDDWSEDSFLFVDKDQLAICRPVEFDFMPTWKCLNSLDWEILK
jgi:hypothetical protein